MRGYYQTVATGLSLINYAYVTRYCIGEGVEIMSDKIHLEDRLLGAHGLEGEGLDSYLEIALLIVFVVILLTYDKGTALQLFLYLGLILTNLSFKSLDGAVKSSHKGLALVLASENSTAVVYGNLEYFRPLTRFAGDECLGVVAKELVKLGELLLHECLKALAHRHLFSVNRNLHTDYPAPTSEHSFLFSCGCSVRICDLQSGYLSAIIL